MCCGNYSGVNLQNVDLGFALFIKRCYFGEPQEEEEEEKSQIYVVS